MTFFETSYAKNFGAIASTLSYFTKATLEDGIPIMGSKIYRQLHNPMTKMYFAFLAYILKGIDKLSLV